jgi:hypothetical protein
MERFNLKKFNDVQGKEQYSVEISNRFPALTNLDAEVNTDRAWETIRVNIKISAKDNLGYENEVEVPSSVINHGFLLLFNFSSPLHVSASSGDPQKERGKLLIYQDQPVIISPIPHALLLYMWELVTLIRHSTSCIRIICSSENPMDCL